MIERLYVHNYRCLENFTLDLKGKGSALLIGKNGAGKSALRQALGVLQEIGRGASRPRDCVAPTDFTQHRFEVPVRFELDAILGNEPVAYGISFKLNDPSGDRPELVVFDEVLTRAGEAVFSRKNGEITFVGHTPFPLNPTTLALTTFGGVETDRGNTIPRFRAFLASMILVAPIPSQMSWFTTGESDRLEVDARNFASWFNAILTQSPAAYVDVEAYLREVLRDFGHLARRPGATAARGLVVVFKGPSAGATLPIDFGGLSDGEKCFFLSAAILGYARHAGPVFCFWDEPDNHLSLPEVQHFIAHLRRMANRGSQFVATSHHPEVIRSFADENTFVLTRNSHSEPTLIRTLGEYEYHGDLINALLRDEVIG